MLEEPGTLVDQHVVRHRDRAAGSYDSVDFLHQRAHEGLLDRLAPLVMTPKTIVNLGSGTGTTSRALAKHYRRARVLSIDNSQSMLRVAHRKRTFLSRSRELCARSDRLPLTDASVDLVYSNLWLAWVDDLQASFKEVSRVLRKGGVFAFATLGPDSFTLLREARAGDIGVRAFVDMHDVGDLLVGAGLAEPVLDVDKLTITYDSADALFRDLSAVGARNSLKGRRRSLTGKKRFAAFKQALEGDDGPAIDIELVFGHAWGVGPRPPAGEFRIDPSAIGRSPRVPGSR